jgi:hypothetical protein
MADSLIDDGTSTKGHPQAQRIAELYKEGTDDIRDAQLQYQENAAYIEGDQWIWRSSTRQEILRLPRRDKSKIRATIPRLGPESRRLFSKLLRRPLVFEVVPDAPDDATIRGARVAEAVLTAKAREDKWNKVEEDVAWGAWKGGTSFLCLDWDTTRGKYVGDGPTTGAPLNEGDICTTALTISEVATEPGTKDIERACWWIKAQVLPPAEVKKTYGLGSVPPPNASAGQSVMQREVARTGGRTNNLCLVLTYYERPNKDNKKGSVVTVVGDQVVDGPHDWPFPFTDRLNIVAVKETSVEGRWYGRTVVSDAVPIQTAYNHTWTSILEHLKQAGNARIQGNSAERSNADTWTDEAGEFVFYDTDKWEWMSPPPMPDWWSRLPDQLASAMDDTIGVHDISRGNAPANIESGLGLSVLAEQDDTPTGKFSQTLADAFGDYATLVLRTYEAKVPQEEQREITLYEPGAKIAEKVTWSGQSFEGQVIARVPYDAVAPMNDAARWARGLAMVDRQIIQGGRALAKYLDVEGANDFAAALDPQIEKARRENAQLALGEAVVPADFDDHKKHIEEHNDFRLSARYERLDDQTRGLVDLHVQAHSTLAAEEAALQMARMNQGQPAAAAAAQASAPPGSGMLDQMFGVPPQGSDAAAPISATLGAQTGGDPDAEMAPPGPDAEDGMPAL